MPFFGSDWRDPEGQWIKTENGWRPLPDLSAQIVHVVSHFRQLTGTSSSKSGSPSRSRGSPTQTCHQAETRRFKCAAGRLQDEAQVPGSNFERRVRERELYLKQLYLLLSMKSVTIGSQTSRENSRYSTLSDAIQKMNFQQALNDKNCFPFVCKVLLQIFEGYYSTCSGSLQSTLLKITEAAKGIAVETHLHDRLVVNMIEKAIAINEKLRHAQHTVYGIRNIDSKIKSLLKMKREVRESQLQHDVGGATRLLDLPDECLLHITSFLCTPQDVLNLGLADTRLHYITQDNTVWRTLTCYHFSQLDPKPTLWSELFVQCYKDCGGKLKEGPTCAMSLCTSCNRMFWKSYGHPCIYPDEAIIEPISPLKFMQIFT